MRGLSVDESEFNDMVAFEFESLDLSLTPQELLSTVQALFHEIHDRMIWAMQEGHWYRQTPLEDAQTVLNAMVSAHQKALILVQELAEDDKIKLDADFMDTFTFPPEVWKVLDSMTLADTWQQIPTS